LINFSNTVPTVKAKPFFSEEKIRHTEEKIRDMYRFSEIGNVSLDFLNNAGSPGLFMNAV